MADRWHLVKNLREAVQRFLTRQPAYLEQAAAVPQGQWLEHTTTAGSVARLSSRSAHERQHHRATRYARSCQVLALHHQGVAQQQSAHTLGMHTMTVRTFLRAGALPARATSRRRSQLDPYVAFLHQRWRAGGQNPTHLWHEIVTQGYRGPPRMVRCYIARLGQHVKAFTPEQRARFLRVETIVKTPTVRRATFWFLKAAEALTPEQRACITQLCPLSPEIKEVRTLAHACVQRLRERHAGRRRTWLDKAEPSTVSEIRRFATGMRQDAAAVTAALE